MDKIPKKNVKNFHSFKKLNVDYLSKKIGCCFVTYYTRKAALDVMSFLNVFLSHSLKICSNFFFFVPVIPLSPSCVCVFT